MRPDQGAPGLKGVQGHRTFNVPSQGVRALYDWCVRLHALGRRTATVSATNPGT